MNNVKILNEDDQGGAHYVEVIKQITETYDEKNPATMIKQLLDYFSRLLDKTNQHEPVITITNAFLLNVPRITNNTAINQFEELLKKQRSAEGEKDVDVINQMETHVKNLRKARGDYRKQIYYLGYAKLFQFFCDKKITIGRFNDLVKGLNTIARHAEIDVDDIDI